MSASAPSVVASAASSRSRAFRVDIQALRAFAIAAVMLNHLWPLRLTGGYIGVDVFFVISGFLITNHLFSEVIETGRISLGRFYARRIRRLLPAALLVLFVAGVMVAVFLPYPRWERNAAEIAASATYVENWLLAALSVNYSAANEAASVAQHYWSLSVEEQFYLVWPVLILAVAFLMRHVIHRPLRARTIAVTLAALGLGSFAGSILFTAVSPCPAYFVTFTRAWEFAAGGLIAMVGTRFAPGRALSVALSAAGLAAILLAAVWFGPNTPFPGAAALLPVAGTAALLVAGTSGDRTWHSWFSGSRPVQWLGDVSYSAYLWHWPLIVLCPFVLGVEPTTLTKIGVLVAALVLAGLSRRWVEVPAQRAALWSRSVVRPLVGMAIGMIAVLIVAGGLSAGYTMKSTADSPTAPVATGRCVGPGAIANATCKNPFGPARYTTITAKNDYAYTPPQCTQQLKAFSYGDIRTTRICDYSGGRADPTTVWLVGDSHAQQWQGAVLALAQQRHWKVTTSYYGGCPVADVAFVGFRISWGPGGGATCMQWARDVSQAIADQRPTIVFTSMSARHELVDDGSGRSSVDQFAGGLVRDWDRWADAGVRVIAIADPPFNGDVRDPDCVIHNARNPVVCARPRAQAQPATDPLPVAVLRAHRAQIQLIDLTSSFCDSSRCYAVIGGEPVYCDPDHVNLQYVRMLVPEFAKSLDDNLARSSPLASG